MFSVSLFFFPSHLGENFCWFHASGETDETHGRALKIETVHAMRGKPFVSLRAEQIIIAIAKDTLPKAAGHAAAQSQSARSRLWPTQALNRWNNNDFFRLLQQALYKDIQDTVYQLVEFTRNNSKAQLVSEKETALPWFWKWLHRPQPTTSTHTEPVAVRSPRSSRHYEQT